MKIKFTCSTCNESFNVSFENLIKKDFIVCPNCSTKFPPNSFNALKEGIKYVYSCNNQLFNEESGKYGLALFEFKFTD